MASDLDECKARLRTLSMKLALQNEDFDAEEDIEPVLEAISAVRMLDPENPSQALLIYKSIVAKLEHGRVDELNWLEVVLRPLIDLLSTHGDVVYQHAVRRGATIREDVLESVLPPILLLLGQPRVYHTHMGLGRVLLQACAEIFVDARNPVFPLLDSLATVARPSARASCTGIFEILMERLMSDLYTLSRTQLRSAVLIPMWTVSPTDVYESPKPRDDLFFTSTIVPITPSARAQLVCRGLTQLIGRLYAVEAEERFAYGSGGILASLEPLTNCLITWVNDTESNREWRGEFERMRREVLRDWENDVVGITVWVLLDSPERQPRSFPARQLLQILLDDFYS